MEAPELFPLPDDNPRPELRVIEGDSRPELRDWYTGPDSFRVQVVKDSDTGEFMWKLNGDNKGLVDWDEDKGEGYIDGADNVPAEYQARGGAVKVAKASWKLITICMHHINGDQRLIETPVGLMEFDASHQVRLH